MKKLAIFLGCLLIGGHILSAQSNPVTWVFTAKKQSDKIYEITLTATVKPPWHIYSLHTPDGGPVPTKITYNKNPIIIMDGEIKEVGKKITKYEDVFDMNVVYFDGQVSFLQAVKLKTKAKTIVSGTIEYMVCNDKECLPPLKIPFSVALE